MKKIIIFMVSAILIGSLFSPVIVLAKEMKPTPIIKPGFLPGPPEPVQSGGGEPSEAGGGQVEALTQTGFQAYLQGFVGRYLPAFLGFIAIAAVFVIIIGGIMFLTAFGNEEKLGTAKKIVQWAVIGLVLAMFGYAIVNIILRLPLPGA